EFEGGPGRPLEEVEAKIDQLARQINFLENSVTENMQHILNKLKNMENIPKVDLKNGILSSLDNRQINDNSIKKKKIAGRPPALTQRSASEPKTTSNMSGTFVHNFPKHQQSTATVSGCYSYLQVHMPTQPNSSNEFLRVTQFKLAPVNSLGTALIKKMVETKVVGY
ncbi:hypothetical protein TSAR_011265, partial [Trichomalopsis sarcophagae]